MVESIILTDSQLKKFLDSQDPPLSKEDYELELSAFQELKKEMYLFSWEKVQKKINKKFIDFLKKRFDIDWVITANIEKIDEKTIKVSNEINHFLLKLNSGETKVNIEIDDGRTDEFVVKTRNDELRIYKEIVLPYILNVDHLSSVCGISPKQLHLFISNKRKAYSTFKLPKKRGGYLFSWDNIPGNDNGRLIEFLSQKFGIDWIKTAKIEKIDDVKTIRVTNGKNYLSLKLNDERTKVNFEIDGDRIAEFIARTKNGKLNIYGGGFRSIDAPSKNMKLVQRWILDNILYLKIGTFSNYVP
ncbi:MAG: hypothetical protein KKA10_02490 [Euryarchaeota archaeon]|nr:hypothetical protein [Euryarchaeota archaeon]MCG2736674.1 hypothetical protein [Candidatus Methanoperedenaceae archaeon]